MKKDPIVEEVRKAREKHASRFDYDLRAICDDFKEKEKHYDHPIVSLPPKRLLKKTGT